MRRSVQLLCAALFVGTTFCSLWLSASSTLHKAELVHVPDGAVWSAVGVLELVSLAGTMRWLIARNRRGRVHAIGVVAAVAVVTGFAGWAAYGWFGLVAPIAVVATIHMVHETLDDLAPTGQRWGGPDEVAPTAAQAAVVQAIESPTPPDAEPAAGEASDQDDEEERNDGPPVDHRLIAWDELTKDQAQAEARRLTARGHRVTQSRKTLEQLQGDVRDARRLLGEEPAA